MVFFIYLFGTCLLHLAFSKGFAPFSKLQLIIAFVLLVLTLTMMLSVPSSMNFPKPPV